MLLGANLVIARISGGYFDLDAESNALLNTWSLSVEEQFYLVFPALLMLGFAIARRVRYARWVPGSLVLGVGAVSFFAALLEASGYVLPRESWLLGFYSPVTRAWEFAAGALLALYAPRIFVLSRRCAGAFAVAGVALLAVSPFVIDDTTTLPGPLTLLPVLGTMSLLLAGADPANRIGRLLSTPALVRVGDWSYSIYLWHWPLIAIATLRWPNTRWVAPAAAVVSILPAIASYRWVEAPIRAYNPPR